MAHPHRAEPSSVPRSCRGAPGLQQRGPPHMSAAQGSQQTSLDPSDGIDILVNNAGRELLLNASLLISNMAVLLTMSVSTKFGPVTCRVVPRAKPPRFGSFLVMDHAQETSSNFSHQPSHCGVLFMYRNEGPAISSPLWAIFDEARNHRIFLRH